MKKFAAILPTLILISFALPSSAQAIGQKIELVERPHQLLDGKFIDDELATLLAPEGRLGSLVYTPNIAKTHWYIDAALIDEVIDMADGYDLVSKEDGIGVDVATAWLAQLRIATTGATVTALAYGNPDLKLAKRLAPSELSFYYAYGAERLSTFFNRPISVDKSAWKSSTSKLSGPLRKNYTVNRQATSKLLTVVSAPELELFRARLALLLSPSINGNLSEVFGKSALDGVAIQQNKLRVNPGKYALTSESGKVPLTLVNDFSTEVKINLIFRASNIRVLVDDVRDITLAPQSRTQLALPYTVITSGATQVSAVLANSKGQWLGPSSRLALSMTLIDSKVAWFTTAAAVLLFIGAGAQTYRRIRKGRR
ncbi:MAG: DUF6049 family protein [Candidatus Planktophila sp.]